MYPMMYHLVEFFSMETGSRRVGLSKVSSGRKTWLIASSRMHRTRFLLKISWYNVIKLSKDAGRQGSLQVGALVVVCRGACLEA